MLFAHESRGQITVTQSPSITAAQPGQDTPTTEAAWREVAAGFETKWQFPNCLGAIDGIHIYIQPPANSGSTYHNYKSRFSIVLSWAGKDVQMEENLVPVRHPTAMTKPTEYPRSRAHSSSSNITLPYAFVGDEAFPLRNDVMKPFSFRNLDHGQRIFNYRLSEQGVQ
ncbi:hypothetical protein QQF64_034505 [Cirrhinus molitorella]|uniref:DDE Tnp4 domain-containing protein n=1 Tax=Cirrhinus molitorella TaxID=172907 RepID=A0ABR3L251_9TELE